MKNLTATAISNLGACTVAGTKGRSGRKKQTTVKKQQPRQPRVEILPPVTTTENQPPLVEEKKPSLLETMRVKIVGLLPQASSPQASSPQNESPTQSDSGASTPEFEVVAEKMEEKYGSAGEPATGSGPNVATPPLNVGPGHVITPSTVESWLVMIFGGLSKAYGEHWKLDETDKTVLVPVYTAAIDEQAPRWFAESENKALWIAVIVTVLFIVSRSKNGGRLVEWGIDKIGSLVSKVGGSTKTA
jgi:hypothetical protein